MAVVRIGVAMPLSHCSLALRSVWGVFRPCALAWTAGSRRSKRGPRGSTSGTASGGHRSRSESTPARDTRSASAASDQPPHSRAAFSHLWQVG
eukprot:2419486-Prymnesium_polylepis.1